MSKKPEVRVSVHGIVDFFHRDGDILPGAPDTEAFVEGGVAHREVQSDRGEGYEAEVSLERQIEGKKCIVVVSGRADGIETTDDGATLEEIKSTRVPLDRIGENDHPEHWAQALLYAGMYIADRPGTMTIRLVYIHRTTRKTIRFERRLTPEEIETQWTALTEAYVVWMDRLVSHRNKRDRSLASLEFPFSTFRSGQRGMAERVYRTIRDTGLLFLEAPTGIGKTMGVLYPAIKALGYGFTSKIFYLTAKTIARSVAEDAVQRLMEAGGSLKSVTLTAKAKICFILDEGSEERPPCNPDDCPYARGHYSRIDNALSEVFKESLITREVVERFASKHRVCPFEFSLDISNWTDIVICDYNYAFDPRVQLQRFFQRGKSDRTLLVDEAHNLVDRGRSMFSASIRKSAILRGRKSAKESFPAVARALGLVNSGLLSEKKRLQEHYADEDDAFSEPQGSIPGSNEGFWIARRDAPTDIEEPVRTFLREFEFAAREGGRIPVQLIDLYFDLLSFLKVLEWYGPAYLTLYRSTKHDLFIDLSCIDPSSLVAQTVGKSKASIFFSATLEPMRYFISLIVGGLETDSVALDSPFPRHNLCLIIDPTISTRYRKRDDSYDRIAERIESLVLAKAGNYLVFFPSYTYSEQVRLRFAARRKDVTVMYQTSGMAEAQRESFLARFVEHPDESLIGFVVMGGIFAEGIDLQGSRLDGAIIVGPGLPQVGPERDIIRFYFDSLTDFGERRGFDYAYTYPGFNRVQQAAGRVIRTEADRGVVMLIDDRFGQRQYHELFPPEWCDPVVLDEDTDLTRLLQRFWSDA